MGGESHDASPPDGAAPPSNSGEEPERPTTSSVSASSFSARTAAKTSSKGSSSTYTEEQITIVRQIKIKKDYFQILGLERGCAVEDVRKAYQKLPLKVHPDKNKAPDAEEAFKLASKAFQCPHILPSRPTSAQRHSWTLLFFPPPIFCNLQQRLLCLHKCLIGDQDLLLIISNTSKKKTRPTLGSPFKPKQVIEPCK